MLGLFAALIWATRKFGARGGGNKNIPKEVFQTLGSTSIDPRTQVSLLRCGQRILILARTNNGVHPLGEITDKDEVRHLIATCTGDSKQEFHNAWHLLNQSPQDLVTSAVNPNQMSLAHADGFLRVRERRNHRTEYSYIPVRSCYDLGSIPSRLSHSRHSPGHCDAPGNCRANPTPCLPFGKTCNSDGTLFLCNAK